MGEGCDPICTSKTPTIACTVAWKNGARVESGKAG